jgi:hypothetical protein
VKFPDKASTLVIFGGVVNAVIEKGRMGKVVNEVRPDKSTTCNPVDPDKFRLVNRGKLPKPLKLVNDRGVVNDVKDGGSPDKVVNEVRPDKFATCNPVEPDKFSVVNRGKSPKALKLVNLGGVVNSLKDGGSPDKVVNLIRPDKFATCNPVDPDKSRVVNRGKLPKPVKVNKLGGVVNDVNEFGNVGKVVNSVRPDKFKDVNPVRPDKFALVSPVEPDKSRLVNRGKPVKLGIDVILGGVFNVVKDGGSPVKVVICAEGDKSRLVNRGKPVKLGKLDKFGGDIIVNKEVGSAGKDVNPVRPDKFALVSPVEPVASMFANRGKLVNLGIDVNPGGVTNVVKDGGSSGMADINRDGSKFNVVKFGGGPLSSLKFALVVRETGPIFLSNDKSGSVGGIVHEGFVLLNRTIS